MGKIRYLWLALLACPGLARADDPAVQAPDPVVQVGSKAFTESVILGELVKHLCTAAEVKAVHRSSLGDTSKAWTALLKGELDVYPEYTGTLMQEILADERLVTMAQLTASLKKRGVRMSRSLG